MLIEPITKPLLYVSQIFGLSYHKFHFNNNEIVFAKSRFLCGYCFVFYIVNIIAKYLTITKVQKILDLNDASAVLLQEMHNAVSYIFILIVNGSFLINSKRICQVFEKFNEFFTVLQFPENAEKISKIQKYCCYTLFISFTITIMEDIFLFTRIYKVINIFDGFWYAITQMFQAAQFAHYVTLVFGVLMLFRITNEAIVEKWELNESRVRCLIIADDISKDIADEISYIFSIMNAIGIFRVALDVVILVTSYFQKLYVHSFIRASLTAFFLYEVIIVVVQSVLTVREV